MKSNITREEFSKEVGRLFEEFAALLHGPEQIADLPDAGS